LMPHSITLHILTHGRAIIEIRDDNHWNDWN
ncbi:hypothetical protein T08_5068, partial [Trichinella sp. T8]